MRCEAKRQADRSRRRAPRLCICGRLIVAEWLKPAAGGGTWCGAVASGPLRDCGSAGT